MKRLGDTTMSDIQTLLKAATSVLGSTILKYQSIRIFQETAFGLKESYCAYNKNVT
jgi:hypothetical protein